MYHAYAFPNPPRSSVPSTVALNLLDAAIRIFGSVGPESYLLDYFFLSGVLSASAPCILVLRQQVSGLSVGSIYMMLMDTRYFIYLHHIYFENVLKNCCNLVYR